VEEGEGSESVSTSPASSSLNEGEGAESVSRSPSASRTFAERLLNVPSGGGWVVPWTLGTVIRVMVIWFISFLLVGHCGLPALARLFGFDRALLSDRSLALYSLCTDVIEMVVGLGVLRRCLRPYFPLPEGWFVIRWRGRWWIEMLCACLVFPLVSMLNQVNQDLLPGSTAASPWDQSLAGQDPVANLLYVLVVSFFAPIWEEAIFRGFLLPSLTRYLRVELCVGVSAAIFALAHFSIERLLPLTFLGVVMGVVFVRSRNLLAPIFLHAFWNGFALAELL